MKNTIRFLVLICCSVFLFGCPYSSEVPISRPTAPQDASLLGKWVSKSGDEDIYTVTREGNEYKIEKKSKSGETETYKGFISEIKGTKFFNVYDTKDAAISYSLYKMDISQANIIVLNGLSENIQEKFTTSAELKAFVEKYMGLSFFFDKEDETYIRKK